MLINKNLRLLLILFATTLMASCASTKQFSYFQDLETGSGRTKVIESSIVHVRPQDKIYVLVSGKDSRLAAPYNIQTTGTSTGAQRDMGYTVDENGNIKIPGLGDINVGGLTRKEIASKIEDILVERQLIKDPVVLVEFMNLTFTVLGDVGSPGRYSIDKDQITILDAIAMAGDLTITGKRQNVMVLRYENGEQRNYTVDLTSAQQVLTSPVYYLRQNDIVYVEASKLKANQATANGNTFRSVSFWMSTISFLTTMILLFTK